MNNEKYNQIIDDAYKNYCLKKGSKIGEYGCRPILLTKEEFINKIKTDNEFSEKWGLKVEERELSYEERIGLAPADVFSWTQFTISNLDELNVPKRAISLMWNQRSVDTFLGLPFNIASYGLLLEMIAKEVNMVPDELIGNLGDVHLYLNHIEQAKSQTYRSPFALPKLNVNSFI